MRSYEDIWHDNTAPARYFVADSGPNEGYVFRLVDLRQRSPIISHEDSTIDAYLECLLPGHFVVNLPGDQVISIWTWIMDTMLSPSPLIYELYDGRIEEKMLEILNTRIGEHHEISPNNLGKWSPDETASVAIALGSFTQETRESITLMTAKQMDSFVALILTSDRPPSDVNTLQDFVTHMHPYIPSQLQGPFSKVREKSQLPSELLGGIHVLRDLGMTGEGLFDFLVSDLEDWWMSSWQKKKMALSIAPEAGILLHSYEDELATAIQMSAGDNFRSGTVEFAQSASEVQELMMKYLPSIDAPIENSAEIRRRLYADDRRGEIATLPISSDEIEQLKDRDQNLYLHQFLVDTNFFEHAEKFLHEKKLRLVMSPVAGRTLWRSA